MKPTFQQVFEVVKSYATEMLNEYDEPVPNEGSYNTIIQNAMVRLFDDIQEEVRVYNTTMDNSDFDNTIEFIGIEVLEWAMNHRLELFLLFLSLLFLELVYSLLDSAGRCQDDEESKVYYESLADEFESLLNRLKVLPLEDRVAKLMITL